MSPHPYTCPLVLLLFSLHAQETIFRKVAQVFSPLSESRGWVLDDKYHTLLPNCKIPCSFLKLPWVHLPSNSSLPTPPPAHCMVNLYKPAIPNNAILPFLEAPWLFTGYNVWWSQHVLIFTLKKKKKNSRGERVFDGKSKPLQALKEALKSEFPKYSNSVKVVTCSGAQGDTHPDPSVKAISSQEAFWKTGLE